MTGISILRVNSVYNIVYSNTVKNDHKVVARGTVFYTDIRYGKKYQYYITIGEVYIV